MTLKEWEDSWLCDDAAEKRLQEKKNTFRDELNRYQELVEAIRRDIRAIGCIYSTVGKALYDEPMTRLAERIAHTVKKLQEKETGK